MTEHDYKLAGLIMDSVTVQVRPPKTASTETSGEMSSPSAQGRHEWCICRRCVGLWEAVIAANPDGTPFFTDAELESMSLLPVEAWG